MTDAELLSRHHELGVVLGADAAAGRWMDAYHHRAEMRTIADRIRARLAEVDDLRAQNDRLHGYWKTAVERTDIHSREWGDVLDRMSAAGVHVCTVGSGVARLIRERDEARAEIERLRAIIPRTGGW